MRSDLRFAWRMISSHRWFSAAVIATLALGIGLNTMVFTLIDAALFKPVQIPGGERLITILTRDSKTNQRDRQRMPVSWPDFLDYKAHAASLEALEAGSSEGATLSETGIAPQHYSMFRISSGFFGMLHMKPLQGRDFTPADSKSGAAPVILLGHVVWKERYSGRDVIGHVVRVNGKPATIAGVMPEGFRFPSEQDLWMPLQAGAELEDRSHRPLQLFGMLKPGLTISQARAEFDLISRRLQTSYPKDDANLAALVQTFHQRYNGDDIQLVFSLMMGAVGFVLLIACANVANMLLGRALARRREISIRAAMGASRWQVVRQLLIESLLLSVLGGLAGLALSAWGVHAFDLATQDVGKPYWVQFTMDYRVFVYFAVVCVSSALVFGLVPALRSCGEDVFTSLKDGTRSVGTRSGGYLSSLLVVFQFALTLVLLLDAGVFMRTFLDKQSVNRWMPGDQLMTARINLPEERYKDEAARHRFFEQLLTRLQSIPGVSGAAVTSDLPTTGSVKRRIEIEGSALKDREHGPSASVVVKSPGYFAAINLPILRGRDFDALDGSPAQLRAVVTRTFAARHWGNQDALGKRFRFYDRNKPGEWISVIGVSGDVVQSLDTTEDPLLFLPYRQEPRDSMALVVRTPHPTTVAAPLRAAVQGMDQDLPLLEVRTMTEMVERQIWFLRLFGTVFLVFAAIALLMASVGIYAVMAQATAARTQEIGVRMALGATPGDILALVLKRGVWQLIAGLGAGVAVAIPVTLAMGTLRSLSAPSDPATIGAVAVVITTAGLFACWLPARRAAALNPVNAIRDE